MSEEASISSAAAEEPRHAPLLEEGEGMEGGGRVGKGGGVSVKRRVRGRGEALVGTGRVEREGKEEAEKE